MARKIVAQTGRSIPSDISGDLQVLGFSEYEARTYLTLLTHSPATAYEVSRDAGLPRSNTYSALESLAKKQAVQPVSKSPVRYVPVAPATLLGRMSREVNDVCDRLVASLRTLERQDEPEIVWRLDGAAAIDEKIKEIIDSAKQHIWIKAAHDMLEEHINELHAAADRGVEILIILFGTDTRPFQFNRKCKIYLHEGNGVRIGGSDNLFTIAVDYETALTASLAGEVVGSFTRSKPVVRMAETLIRHDYYIAEIFSRFGAEIDREFGPFLQSLRRKTFPPDQLALLEKNVKQFEAGTLATPGYGAAGKAATRAKKAVRKKG